MVHGLKKIDSPNLSIHDTTIGRLWHRFDDRTVLPITVVRILLRTSATERIPDTDNTHNNNPTCWDARYQSGDPIIILAAVYKETLAHETYDTSLSRLHVDYTGTYHSVQQV